MCQRQRDRSFEKLKEDFSWGVLTQQSGYWLNPIGYDACQHRRLTPHFVKSLYITFKNITAGVQQEIKTLEWAGIIKKSLSPWASPIVVVSQENPDLVNPQVENVCWFSEKINDLQPQVRRVDSATSGKHFTGPHYPKFNEMYAALRGAKNIHHSGP